MHLLVSLCGNVGFDYSLKSVPNLWEITSTLFSIHLYIKLSWKGVFGYLYAYSNVQDNPILVLGLMNIISIRSAERNYLQVRHMMSLILEPLGSRHKYLLFSLWFSVKGLEFSLFFLQRVEQGLFKELLHNPQGYSICMSGWDLRLQSRDLSNAPVHAFLWKSN